MAEADDFVLGGVREAMKDGVASPSGQNLVEIIDKDSQSDPNRAAEAAAELIRQDDIDLMVVGASPGNSNPVSDQCEANGVPCISTVTPWQAWFFGRGGDPAMGFKWTYHYFWGLEAVVDVFTSIWDQVSTNKTVGLLLADDGDGNAWGDPPIGLPRALTGKGFKVVDPGRFQPMQSDFGEQVSAFKKADVEIVCGVPTPTDFKTFWTQARQMGYKPKVVTMGKAYSFPTIVDAMGDLGIGLSQELWWTPTNPFKSSLSGVTDKVSLRDAMIGTALDTIVGRINWSKGPVKNVCKTPLVAGQWVKGAKNPYDLIVVANTKALEIPVAAKPIPIPE